MTYDIYKPSYNEEFRAFEWQRADGSGQLAPGITLASTTMICTEALTGTDRTADMIEQVTVYDSTQTKYKLKAGTKNLAYNLEFRCVDSNGQHLSDTLILKVI